MEDITGIETVDLLVDNINTNAKADTVSATLVGTMMVDGVDLKCTVKLIGKSMDQHDLLGTSVIGQSVRMAIFPSSQTALSEFEETMEDM